MRAPFIFFCYNITKMKKPENEQKLHDVNRLPKQPGLLIFYISPSKIGNIQNAKNCFDWMEHFTGEKNCKVTLKQMGLNFIYGDYLYLFSCEQANSLRDKLLGQISSHKYNFLKIFNKAPWYIDKGVSFTTWNQTILDTKEYNSFYGQLKKIYKKDKEFQQYVKEDSKEMGRKLDQNQVNFILEEILLFYLIAKGKTRLRNNFVHEQHKWILNCYPGKPLKSEMYLFQKNFFKLDYPINKYQNDYYDLEAKRLYEYDKIDLANF